MNWQPLWWAIGGGSWKFNLRQETQVQGKHIVWICLCQCFEQPVQVLKEDFGQPVQVLKKTAPVKVDLLLDVVDHQRLVRQGWIIMDEKIVETVDFIYVAA